MGHVFSRDHAIVGGFVELDRDPNGKARIPLDVQVVDLGEGALYLSMSDDSGFYIAEAGQAGCGSEIDRDILNFPSRRLPLLESMTLVNNKLNYTENNV
ncbi:hypothetical protein NW840_13365 [Synechococcus sp. R5-13]